MCSGLSNQIKPLHGDATASREAFAAAAAMLSGGLWAEPRFFKTKVLGDSAAGSAYLVCFCYLFAVYGVGRHQSPCFMLSLLH